VKLKISLAICIVLLCLIIIGTPVLATIRTWTIQATETTGFDLVSAPFKVTMDIPSFISSGYMASDGLDSQILDGSTQIPHMIATDGIWFVGDINSHATKNFTLTTGNTPSSSMPIIVGNGGYITTPYNAAIAPTGDWEIDISTDTLDSTVTDDKFLLYTDKITIKATDYQEITAEINTDAGIFYDIVTGIPNGQALISVTYIAGVLTLTVTTPTTGTSTEYTSGGGTIADTNSDWIWDMNNVMPSINYIKVYLGNTIPPDIGVTDDIAAYASAAGLTQISLDNPATASGIIDTIHIYEGNHSTYFDDLSVGTFIDNGGGNYTCRDSVSIGHVDAPTGAVDIAGLNLAVSAGDYIGFYCSAGTIGWVVNGYSGEKLYSGNGCSDGFSFHSPTLANTNGISIYGSYKETYTEVIDYEPNDVIDRITGILPDLAVGGYDGVITFGTGISANVPYPLVLTIDATAVTSTSATLQGQVTSMGGYGSVDISFNYGLTTSYGSTTVSSTLTSTGSFAFNVTGLSPATTYHFQAVAKYGLSYVYGEDKAFTTSLVTGGTTTVAIVNNSVKAFSGYLETGDWLFVAEVTNTYSPYYPNSDISRYFQIQLLDPTGTTILAANSLMAWGDQPISIYLNATTASSIITEGSLYKVKVIGVGFGSPPSSTYTMTANDWEGADMGALDTWVIRGAAVNMSVYAMSNSYTNTTDMLVSATDSPTGSILTDKGGGYFTVGIPALSDVRPNLFQSAKSTPRFTKGTANNVYDNTTWVSGHSYVFGDKTAYAGIVYICVVNVSGTTVPASDGAHWIVSNTSNAWLVDTSYVIGNIRAYGGKLYTCTANVTNNDPPPNDTSHWTLISNEWVSGGIYVANDKVTYNNVAYNCILGTAGVIAPPSDTTHWVEIVGGVWEAQTGNVIANDTNFFGSIFGMRGNNFLGYLLALSIFGLAAVGIIAGGKALPLLVLCFPLLLLGNQMRVIGISYTVVLCILSVFIFGIKYFVSRT
jgi:hypothetical protein